MICVSSWRRLAEPAHRLAKRRELRCSPWWRDKLSLITQVWNNNRKHPESTLQQSCARCKNACAPVHCFGKFGAQERCAGHAAPAPVALHRDRDEFLPDSAPMRMIASTLSDDHLLRKLVLATGEADAIFAGRDPAGSRPRRSDNFSPHSPPTIHLGNMASALLPLPRMRKPPATPRCCQSTHTTSRCSPDVIPLSA